jgi:SAM-dependent methyltransferase
MALPAEPEGGDVSAVQYHDLIASFYEEGCSDDAPSRLELETERSRISGCLERLAGPATVLDAGGGIGDWTERLVMLGHSVTYVDASERMFARACERFERIGIASQVHSFCMDLLAFLTTRHHAFDLVLLEGDILSYVLSPAEVVRALSDSTSPAALITGSVDNLGYYQQIAADTPPTDSGIGALVAMDYAGIGRRFPSRAFSEEHLDGLFRTSGWEMMDLYGKLVCSGLSPSERPPYYEDLLAWECTHRRTRSLWHACRHLEFVCCRSTCIA